jgi:hypothetical protein
MAFFLKNPMMNSFGRQEGGGFRRREGKLVSPCLLYTSDAADEL